MNGRKLFSNFKPLIGLVLWFLKLVPYKLKVLLLECFSGFPTRLGVAIRYVLLHSICKFVGDNVYIGRYVTFKNIDSLSIGNNVSIHEYTYIDAIGKIDIEDNVSIAHGTSLISFEHGYSNDDKPIKYNPITRGSIQISSDVWIAAGVRVLAGSTISSRVIVGAGSVVKGNLEPKSIYVGTPVRKVRAL